MKKLILIPTAASLLLSCSKSGPSGPSTPSTTYYAKASHHGIISEVKDTLGCSLYGTVFVGGGTAYADIQCMKSAYVSTGFSSKMSAVPIKRSSPIGLFNIASDKTGIYTTFSYSKDGIPNNIGVEENTDSVSKLTISAIDSNAITGTAHLKLKDGSFADIEFRVRNTQ